MGLLSWIIIGLVAGVLAEVVMPRNVEEESANLLGTMIVGVVGAVTGGWLWQVTVGHFNAAMVDWQTASVALIGSLVIISLLRLFTRRSAVFVSADRGLERS